MGGLSPVLQRNDKKAAIYIWAVSAVICGAVAFLTNVKFMENKDMGRHLALLNAIINGTVSMLLIAAFVAVRKKKLVLHKQLMLLAIVLSVLFLLSYIGHHLLAPETKYGETSGLMRTVYFFILITHIALATIILPFILFTAYRSLSGDYAKHKKLARYTWPLWLYVSVTGVLVYLMISPYY
jgi:putative membrane protein